jgi:hypothetical protein
MVDTNYRFWMESEVYLCLNSTTQTQKLMYKYCLLVVTEVNLYSHVIVLRSQSCTATRNAAKFLKKTSNPRQQVKIS